MSDKSAIEWTDATWNPVRGCREVSPGCDHCYAKRFAERWRGIPGHPYEAGFDPRFVPDQLDAPLHWKRPRHIFVNSQSDLLQGAFSNEEIGSVFGVAAACPQHIFQILTKRDERLVKWFKWIAEEGKKLPGRVGEPCPSTSSLEASACVMLAGVAVIPQRQFVDACNESPWPLPNVWVGVSVESPDYLHRVDNLRMVPAAVRFLSLEPLLADLGTINLDGIGWVIVGGESGPGARSMKPEWVRAIRAQCEAEGVPFFFKQWGGLLKKKTGRLLDGRTYDGMP